MHIYILHYTFILHHLMNLYNESFHLVAQRKFELPVIRTRTFIWTKMDRFIYPCGEGKYLPLQNQSRIRLTFIELCFVHCSTINNILRHCNQQSVLGFRCLKQKWVQSVENCEVYLFRLNCTILLYYKTADIYECMELHDIGSNWRKCSDLKKWSWYFSSFIHWVKF